MPSSSGKLPLVIEQTHADGDPTNVVDTFAVRVHAVHIENWKSTIEARTKEIEAVCSMGWRFLKTKASGDRDWDIAYFWRETDLGYEHA